MPYRPARRLARTCLSGLTRDQAVPVLADPVTAGQAQEQRPIETARRTEIDILDSGGVPQFGGARTRLEAPLLSQRGFLFDQEAKPFGVFQAQSRDWPPMSWKAFAMPSRPSSRSRSSVGWFSKTALLNGSNRSRGCCRAAGACRPRLAATLSDRAGV